MVFILSKIIIFFIKPIVWVFGLFGMAVLTKHSVKRKKFAIAGLIVFFLFSNTIIVNKVLNWYEAKYELYQHYDVGIVLGGFANLNAKNDNIEFNRNGDRLFQAIYLYKTGVIKKILISGGSIDQIPSKEIEANVVSKYIREIGIPDSAIIVENKSRNTIENAANSFKMMTKIQSNAKILVITSAIHIPRAKLIFSKYFNHQLAYYPTNHRGKSTNTWLDFVIPDADALISWEIIFKEWIGLVIDRFRA